MAGMDVLHLFICKVVDQIVNPIILLVSAGAFIYFLWGVAQFIMEMSQGEQETAGKRSMLWGIIGLAIIFGAYGIINLALGTFGLGSYEGPGCGVGSGPF